MHHITPLIEHDALATLGTLRLLDVGGADAPSGAISVPIERWVARARHSRSGLDDLGFWQRELEALGIGTDAVSVVMDDGQMTEAARVWFILQHFGLPAVVLNGGRAALGAAPPLAAPAPGPLRLTPGAGRVGLRDRHALKAELEAVQVFDARTAQEFSGADLKSNARGGHLPGAANLSHDALLDGSRLRPVEEIRQMLDAAGIDGARPIVTHCNGGGRAALAALAAVLAGRADVRVYYLSFADWAADESCPLNRPED